MRKTQPQAGQLRRKALLDSTALYRLVEVAGDHVVAEVVDVPGLPEGHRLRLTAASVAEMELLESVADAEEAPRPAARSRRGPQVAGA